MCLSRKLILTFASIFLTLFSFSSYSQAKTYKWDDFKKPFKELIVIRSHYQHVEVYLPESIINNFGEVPLIITTYDADRSEGSILWINDQPKKNAYKFRGGDEREISTRVLIKTRDLQPGLNTLHFYNRGYGWEYDIYELRFDIPQIETLPSAIVKKDTQPKAEKQEKPLEVKAQIESPPNVATKEIPKMKIDVFAARWALVIGISKYQDTRIPSLRYGARDANSFYDWLISPSGGKYAPARVKLLINDKATGNNIKNALYMWLGQALEEDIITLYFAGHGSPQSPDHPENLFLLPYDVQYDSVATTGFPMWDIETALKRFIKAKKVIVIADACHAGGVGQSFDVARRGGRGINIIPISSSLQDLSKIGDGVCIISASNDNQFSQESKKWGGGHGVFTYYLLKGLKGEADYSKDNKVSLGEIIPYLSEQVRRATRNAQTPTVAGRFDPALTIGK